MANTTHDCPLGLTSIQSVSFRGTAYAAYLAKRDFLRMDGT
jgi:hypothetical protein